MIKLTEFTELLRRFRNRVSNTDDIERQAERLANGGFKEKALTDFIHAVCMWGGYAGIAGRVIKNNQPPKLARRFNEARQNAHRGMVLEALKTLQSIKGLGGVSFASKHLKFLAPESAVVLDSIISNGLGYALTLEGYQSFLDDCGVILDRIIDAKLKYPGWGANGWRVCDVEMAIYAKLSERRWANQT